MILDINLPDGDGFGLLRTLRTESDVPALFLSARDADADRLFGLGAWRRRLSDQAVPDAGAAFCACSTFCSAPTAPSCAAAGC